MRLLQSPLTSLGYKPHELPAPVKLETIVPGQTDLLQPRFRLSKCGTPSIRAADVVYARLTRARKGRKQLRLHSALERHQDFKIKTRDVVMKHSTEIDTEVRAFHSLPL